MATVREMMTTNPESVDANATVQEAAQIMRDINVGSVPVLAGGRVAGILTDRDIAVRVIAENRVPAQVAVREIATPSPLTVSPEMDMNAASELMAKNQVRRLPVVEDGTLVGMLALGDLSVEGSSQQAGRALKDISTPAKPDR
jgi:CBS domain-containing protein